MKREWQKNLVWLIIMFMLIGLYVVWGGLDIEELVKQSLPADEAGLLLGILMGDKSAIGKSWYQVFRQAGLLHIVVASGANISILISLIINSLAGLIGRKRATVIGLMVVAGYVGWVGLEAPMVRALIIFLIYYWAQLAGRKFNIVSATILIFYVVVLIDWEILANVSFWLSLLAFLAVYSFKQVKIKTKKFRWLNPIWFNCWINIFIWPITAWVFGEINWLALISNSLVLFGVEIIFGWSMVISWFLGLWPIFAKSLLLLGLPFLRYFLLVAKILSGWQWAIISVQFNELILIGWYVLLLSMLLKSNSKSKILKSKY